MSSIFSRFSSNFKPQLDAALNESTCFAPSGALAIKPEELAGFEKEIYSKEKLITEEEEKEGLKRADERYYAKRVEASARFLCQDSEELRLLYLSLCGRAHHAPNDTSSPEQKAYFRATYLQHLNEMAFLIHRKKSASPEDRIKLLKNFLLQIFPEHQKCPLTASFDRFQPYVICSPGMHNALEQKVNDMTAVILIPDAIARFRQQIVYDWTTKRLAAPEAWTHEDPLFSSFCKIQYRIPQGNETHYHTTTRRFGQSENWNLPIAAGIDQHHDTYETQLTEIEKQSLRTYFYREFSASAILNNLYTHFYSELSKYKNKVEMSLVVQDHVALLCEALGIDDPTEIFDYSSSEPIMVGDKEVVSQLIQLKEGYLQDQAWLERFCFMLGDSAIKPNNIPVLMQQFFVEQKIIPLVKDAITFFENIPYHNQTECKSGDYLKEKLKKLNDLLEQSKKDNKPIDAAVSHLFKNLTNKEWFQAYGEHDTYREKLIQLHQTTQNMTKFSSETIKKYARHQRKSDFSKFKKYVAFWKNDCEVFLQMEEGDQLKKQLIDFSKKLQKIEASIDEKDVDMTSIRQEWEIIHQPLKERILNKIMDGTKRFNKLAFEHPDLIEDLFSKGLISKQADKASTKKNGFFNFLSRFPLKKNQSQEDKDFYERYRRERANWYAPQYRDQLKEEIAGLINQSAPETVKTLEGIAFFQQAKSALETGPLHGDDLDEKGIEKHAHEKIQNLMKDALKIDDFLLIPHFVKSFFDEGLIAKQDYREYEVRVKKKRDREKITRLIEELNSNKFDQAHPVLEIMKKNLQDLISYEENYDDLQKTFLMQTRDIVSQGEPLLDEQVVQLLYTKGFLSEEDKTRYNERQYIEQNILSVLRAERTRLADREDHTAILRKAALDNLIKKIQHNIRQPKQVVENIPKNVETLLFMHSYWLDPDYAWYEQLGRVLLNILSVLIVPAVVKYCVTGTPFYALKCSRTRDVVDKAYDELKNKKVFCI